MKHTKFIAVILSLLILVTFTFTACDKETLAVGARVIETTENSVVIEATATLGSLWDALEYLSGEGELTYDGADGEYGFYITSVNGREADASQNEYWALYTTLWEYEGVQYSNPEYGEYYFMLTPCASASYGASGLPLVEGELYVIVLESY